MNWDDIHITDQDLAAYGPAPRGESSVYSGGDANTESEDWVEDAYLSYGAYDAQPVDGYDIDYDMSDDSVTTYINKATKKATLAFIGTHPNPSSHSILNKAASALGDLNSDFSIAGGQEESNVEFKQVDEKMKAAIAKYGRENIHTTGHSLGGTKAIYASSKYGVMANSFNPGFSPFGILTHGTNLTGTKWDFSRSTAYVVPGDPVSAFAYAQPGLKVQSFDQPEKVAKLREHFTTKAANHVAGAAVGEALASSLNPVAAAAYAALGVYSTAKDAYSLGSDVGALHTADNFLHPRSNIPMPILRDRRHRNTG